MILESILEALVLIFGCIAFAIVLTMAWAFWHYALKPLLLFAWDTLKSWWYWANM